MTREIILPVKFRASQQELMSEVEKFRYFVAVMHRGFGKTYFAMAWLVKMALMHPKKKFAYVAPELKQAKKVTWSEFKRIMGPIPGVETNETELVARLPNGSTIYLEGAENPDRIRGNHYKGVVMDEFGDMPANIWELVIFPALQANRGRALFIGTPKGRNKFYDIFTYSEDPDLKKSWGARLKTIYETDTFDEEQRADIEIQYKLRQAQFAQEYLCSWDAELEAETSVYAKVIQGLQDRGQIGPHSVDPLRPVYVGIDLGLVDQTCIWFAQHDPRSDAINVIDYYENKNQDINYYIQVLKSKPYVYAHIFLPHDSARRSLHSQHSSADIFKAHGYKISILPKTNSVLEDLQAVKAMLHKVWFNSATVSNGLKQLRDYGAKLDRKSGAATEALQHSDCADAFRYLMLGLSTELPKLTNSTYNVKNARKDYVSPLERFRQLNSKKGLTDLWR